MTDIIEKLRNLDNINGDVEESEVERISIIGDEAAAEIEHLRAALAEARETWTDKEGTVWAPPTARDYAMVCKDRNKHAAAVSEARRVMKPFALQADSYGQEPADYVPLDCADYISVGALRRAYQWLEKYE